MEQPKEASHAHEEGRSARDAQAVTRQGAAHLRQDPRQRARGVRLRGARASHRLRRGQAHRGEEGRPLGAEGSQGPIRRAECAVREGGAGPPEADGGRRRRQGHEQAGALRARAEARREGSVEDGQDRARPGNRPPQRLRSRRPGPRERPRPAFPQTLARAPREFPVPAVGSGETPCSNCGVSGHYRSMPPEAAQDGRDSPSDEGPAPPIGLSIPRHRDLEGPLWRWTDRFRVVVTAVLVLFVVLALLNVFGQRPSTAAATSSGVTLQVQAPTAVRGGLIYQARVDVTARRPINRPVITLDGGWLDGMTLNSVQPGPASQTSGKGGATFQYAPLQPGDTL